jgi:predicted metal-binding protein
MTKRKRVLDEFEITEVSAVDKPAQEGARAEIMKRKENEIAEGIAFIKQAHAEFEKCATQIAKRDNCPPHIALMRARQEHPQAFQNYRKAGDLSLQLNSQQRSRRDLLDHSQRANQVSFQEGAEALVESQRRLGKRISRTQAMSSIRKRDPEAFRSAYG